MFEKWRIKKTIFETLGINPRELTARNSEARWTFFCCGDGRVQGVAGHTGDLLE